MAGSLRRGYLAFYRLQRPPPHNVDFLGVKRVKGVEGGEGGGGRQILRRNLGGCIGFFFTQTPIVSAI